MYSKNFPTNSFYETLEMAPTEASRGIYKGYYGRLSKRRDRCAGRKLGKEQPAAPREDGALQNITFFREVAGGERQSFTRYLRRVVGEARAIKSELSTIRLTERPKLNDGLTLEEDRHLHLAQDKDRAEAVYTAYQTKLGRSIEYPIRSSLHGFALLVIGAVEVPVNWLAIQSIVLEAPWIDFLIALAIGCILVSLAHLLGICAKRSLIAFHFIEATERSAVRRYISAAGYLMALIGLGLFLAFIIYRVGLIRQDFVDNLKFGNNSVGGSSLSSALATIVHGPQNASLRDDGWLLIYLNAAILFIGAAISFANHETDSRFAHAKRISDKAVSKLERHQSVVQAARNHLRACDSEVAALEHRRDLIWRYVIATRDERAQMVLLRLGHFADGNRIGRQADVPK